MYIVKYPEIPQESCDLLKRELNLLNLLDNKSFFLFGPRQTGKSTLVREQLTESSQIIDLLDGRTFLHLQTSPFELESLLQAGKKFVVIDEIQKVPKLLDEIHRLIETRKWRFLLTGSSARRLRRADVNLLAGRAWEAQLFPLTFKEIPNFDLNRYLRFGGLPSVYLSPLPNEELDAYVNIYLKEEIAAEGFIRNLPPFARFLKTIALSNGEIINFTQLGSVAQVPPSTLTEYVHVLEDTLLGFFLPAWTESKNRKAIRSGKFYLFDPGVTHTLAQTETLDRNSNLYGKSFEQFIGMELRAYLSYRRIKKPLTFWRTTHGKEVDFLVGRQIAIEVKATSHVTKNDFKGLEALSEENVFHTFFLISQDPLEKTIGKFRAMHWQNFLTRLWDDQLIQ